ncbi:hypothetical protein EV714DRAFT_283421 [Schizophyllum commune]
MSSQGQGHLERGRRPRATGIHTTERTSEQSRGSRHRRRKSTPLGSATDPAADVQGDEGGPNARVWRVYLDESAKLDEDMLQGYRESLDVHIIFAALFSAVVTAFVVQTTQSLQPNYGRITSTLLLELIALQRARSPNDVPSAEISLDNANRSHRDIAVNALFYASLTLSLSTTLVAVLLKQWLMEYSKAPPGSPRDRALIRQLRYNALNAWKVPDIVDIIPVLLHVSLALFLVGLVVFVCGQSELVFYIVLLLTSLTSAFYLFTSIISLGIWTCPYRTSAVTALRKLLSSSYRQLETEAICLNRAHGMSVSLMHDSLVWLWQHTLNPNVHTLVLNTYSGIPVIDDAFEDDELHRTMARDRHSELSAAVGLTGAPNPENLDWIQIERLVHAVDVLSHQSVWEDNGRILSHLIRLRVRQNLTMPVWLIRAAINALRTNVQHVEDRNIARSAFLFKNSAQWKVVFRTLRLVCLLTDKRTNAAMSARDLDSFLQDSCSLATVTPPSCSMDDRLSKQLALLSPILSLCDEAFRQIGCSLLAIGIQTTDFSRTQKARTVLLTVYNHGLFTVIHNILPILSLVNEFSLHFHIHEVVYSFTKLSLDLDAKGIDVLDPFRDRTTMTCLIKLCNELCGIGGRDLKGQHRSFLEELRRLRHRLPEIAYREAFLDSAHTVQAENASRIGSSICVHQVSQYRALRRFQVDVMQGGDDLEYALHSYVTVHWLAARNIAPLKVGGDLVFGPYAVPFSSLDDTYPRGRVHGSPRQSIRTGAWQAVWRTESPERRSESSPNHASGQGVRVNCPSSRYVPTRRSLNTMTDDELEMVERGQAARREVTHAVGNLRFVYM